MCCSFACSLSFWYPGLSSSASNVASHEYNAPSVLHVFALMAGSHMWCRCQSDSIGGNHIKVKAHAFAICASKRVQCPIRRVDIPVETTFLPLSWEKDKNTDPQNKIQIFSAQHNAPIFSSPIERQENRAAREIDSEIEGRILLADPQKNNRTAAFRISAFQSKAIFSWVWRETPRVPWSILQLSDGQVLLAIKKTWTKKKRFQLLLCCAVTTVWVGGAGADKKT